MNNSFNDCVEGCDLPSTPNELKIYLIQIKREVERLMKTTESKLLLHDGKIAEMCNYIKNNLSNTIRCLIDSMQLSGELNNIITDAVNSEITMIKNTYVSVLNFGAIGDGIHDDTLAFMQAVENCNGKTLFAPKTNKHYKISRLVINNLPKINIEGSIVVDDYLELDNEVNSVEHPDINIYRIEGKLKIKGLNSGDVKIGRCTNLELISDASNYFIGYTTFKLGDIPNLTFNTWNKGWINENLFISGRLSKITMNGEYPPEDNLFLKPMIEHADINIINGYRNRFINCRFEGNTKIKYGEGTFGNYIEKTFFGAYSMMYVKYKNHDIDYTDEGDNMFVRNTGIDSINLISINKYNNPYNLPINGDKVEPSNVWGKIYESDIIPLPKCNIALEFLCPDKKVDIHVNLYDANKNLITTNEAVLSSQLSNYGQGTHQSGSPDYDNLMMFITPFKNAKYIKITLRGFGKQMSFKNIEVNLSYKKNTMIQDFIDGFKNPISQ